MDWFLGCLGRAIEDAQDTLGTVLSKARFWEAVGDFPINERQRLVLNRLLDGFEGKLTTSKWAKLAKCSHDTALRDIAALVERGIVSEADMDTCVKWGIGYKLAVIGPMRLLDMAGLDIYSSVASYLNPDLSAAREVPAMVKEKADAGQLGMKTLGGIYPYTAEQVAERRAEIAKGLIAVRKTLSAL